jgi:hypothetical protein
MAWYLVKHRDNFTFFTLLLNTNFVIFVQFESSRLTSKTIGVTHSHFRTRLEAFYIMPGNV